MTKKIVILQPQFAPWIGVFEQIKLADTYVHYDDVQFPLGRSFINRVQIKTKRGVKWLTVPVVRNGKQKINEVLIDNSKTWREDHLNLLKENYIEAKYYYEMIAMVEKIYNKNYSKLVDLNVEFLENISDYFNTQTNFIYSSNIDYKKNEKSDKILSIVKHFDGDVYITGHGAKNYLNHELFEQNNVDVQYMDYKCNEYIQLHGEFTPYVSILDLIANCGKNGIEYINSKTVHWKNFIK